MSGKCGLQNGQGDFCTVYVHPDTEFFLCMVPSSRRKQNIPCAYWAKPTFKWRMGVQFKVQSSTCRIAGKAASGEPLSADAAASASRIAREMHEVLEHYARAVCTMPKPGFLKTTVLGYFNAAKVKGGAERDVCIGKTISEHPNPAAMFILVNSVLR